MVPIDRAKMLAAGLGVCFLAFASVRAARVPLTYDEAASYIRYIDTTAPSAFETNPLSIFNFEVATNHFLNTVLTKICWTIGGSSEIALRVPNLAAYAVFMWFAFQILRSLGDRWIALAGFALVNLNPYVIEFFALSRGYGVSLGLLMGAVFFLVRRDTSRALAFAAAAVMANFAMLDVYLSMFAVVLIASVALDATPQPAVRRAVPIWLPVVAAVFSALVLSQDVDLSPTLYRPVAVTLAGLNESQLTHATVTEIDLHGRERRLARDASRGTWRSNPGAHFRGLRIEMRAADAVNLAGVELLIGNHSSPADSQLTGWSNRDENGTRIIEPGAPLRLPASRLPVFRSALNWAGDAHYAATLAVATAWVLAALAALAALLTAVGWALVRTNLLQPGRWRPLATSALWVAALAGTPIYLLEKHSELYFGGVVGLVPDTFYSLIDRSFHGRIYFSTQTPTVFAVVVSTLVAFAVVLYVKWRRGKGASMRPALVLIGIIVMAALLEVLQRALFQTLYLTDRTALFYVPLYVVFVVFLCQAIADLGRGATILVRALLIGTVAASAAHFVSTANTTYALEWKADASTKTMMNDLRDTVARERPAGSRIALDVEPIYLPVASYYARRKSVPAIDVVPPGRPGVEFYYGDEHGHAAAMRAIRRYPVTGTLLATTIRVLSGT